MNAESIVDTLQSPVSLQHATEAASSSTISSAPLLLSRIPSAILGAISYAITSLTSLLLPMASQLQRAGETLLAAFFLLSVIQAMVALYQYRYDVRGQLVFPDGLTMGKEDYSAGDFAVGDDFTLDTKQVDTKHEEDIMPSQLNGASPSDTTSDGIESSWAAQVVKKLNTSLVLLLPWITRNVHNLLTRNTHLFHVGFIVFMLDSILPFMLDGRGVKEGGKNAHNVKMDSSTASLLQKINCSGEISSRKDPLRVLVIGDSLSIGIGCIEKFDASKDNSLPMALIENTEAPYRPKTNAQSLQGPVFPQVLARTLSHHFERPVQWRSAGVDGGDVNDIRSFCMDVVKQESSSDANIDIIVVLFGMNDLKKLLSVNPIRHLFNSIWGDEKDYEGATVKFRHGMEMLLSEIRSCAPDALVVFPALPIQPFHKNSIINIFPLGLMVDAVLGVWERQKKTVADSWRNTLFLELKAKEIADWYSSNNDGHSIISKNGDLDFKFDIVKNDVLLSADGVHPNKQMYAKWAELVGHKLYKKIMPQRSLLELLERNHDRVSKNTRGAQQKESETKKKYELKGST